MMVERAGLTDERFGNHGVPFREAPTAAEFGMAYGYCQVRLPKEDRDSDFLLGTRESELQLQSTEITPRKARYYKYIQGIASVVEKYELALARELWSPRPLQAKQERYLPTRSYI